MMYLYIRKCIEFKNDSINTILSVLSTGLAFLFIGLIGETAEF